MTLTKNDGVPRTSDEEVAVRQKGQLTKVISSVSDLKQEIEEEKFVAGYSEENIAEWSESAEKTIALGNKKVKAKQRQKESAQEQKTNDC